MGPALAIERAGRGEPLALIHGLGGSKAIWRPQIARLATERDVIALDMPGFGDSDPLPAGVTPTPEALAEAVGRGLERVGVGRAHLAGHSLGAWVALEMARRGRALSLCLISPAGLWRQPPGMPRLNTRPVARRIRPLVSHLLRSRRLRARALRGNVARPERIGREEALALIRSWIDAPAYAATNEEMRAAAFEAVDEIDVPTTIAWGELDRLVRPPHPDRRPGGARFVVLTGCGHTPNWDDPGLVARTLLEASGRRADEVVG